MQRPDVGGLGCEWQSAIVRQIEARLQRALHPCEASAIAHLGEVLALEALEDIAHHGSDGELIRYLSEIAQQFGGQPDEVSR